MEKSMFWSAKGSLGDCDNLIPGYRSSKNAYEYPSLNHSNYLRRDWSSRRQDCAPSSSCDFTINS